ncbi:type II toxin-antitoxin system prevent-host-death family antitoxin [Desulfococcaceae bacterium HSG9]|nr:type II toxin-antitoxin system prevent-host-death family antitoxin [Desulfococcaceae bacterium HSG9]
MLNVDITKAGDCLPELVAQSIDGNRVVITRNGKPVVKLVALAGKKRKRKFGSAKGLIRISDDFDEPLEDFKDYM